MTGLAGGIDSPEDALSPHKFPGDWSPDGRFLAYSKDNAAKFNELWMSEAGQPFPFLQNEFRHDMPVFRRTADAWRTYPMNPGHWKHM